MPLLLPSSTILPEEIGRIVGSVRDVQTFLTYNEVLNNLLRLRDQYPELVRVHTETLPSGERLFHAEVGRRNAGSHDGALMDPHVDEFPSFTTADTWFKYILQDVLNGADRCFHLFGTNPDQAILLEPAIAHANRILRGAVDPLFGNVELVKQLIRHPDPMQIPDWSTAESTLGRQYLEQRLGGVVVDHSLKFWASLHATPTARSYVMLDAADGRFARVAPLLQIMADRLPVLAKGLLSASSIPLDGAPYDLDMEKHAPLPGCRGVYRQVTSRRDLLKTRQDVGVGPLSVEFVWGKSPTTITLTTEASQLLMSEYTQERTAWLAARHVDDSSLTLRRIIGDQVEAFNQHCRSHIENAVEIVHDNRFPSSDPLVQMTKAMIAGPKRWGRSLRELDDYVVDAF